MPQVKIIPTSAKTFSHGISRKVPLNFKNFSCNTCQFLLNCDMKKEVIDSFLLGMFIYGVVLAKA